MFDHSDKIWVNCWREFVGEFIPLLENWLRTTQNEVSMLPAETAYCLKELHKTCDFMYDDIQTLLSYSKFNIDLNEIVKYLKNYSIIKHLIIQKNLGISKKIVRDKKNVLTTKKISPWWKNNLFNKESFLLSFSTLIWN